MDSRKIIFKETARIAIGAILCSAVIVGIFAALGYFQMNVLLSAIVGCGVLIANHFFMAVAVSLAGDRAARGEVQQALKMVQLSGIVRLIVMGTVLVLGIKLGADVTALVLPLAFARPILILAEFFGKKGD